MKLAGTRRVLLAAIAIDLLLGDPQVSWHPVRLIGRALAALSPASQAGSARRQLVGGGTALGGIMTASAAITLIASRSAARVPTLGFVVEAAMLKSTFALRQLLAETMSVGDALKGGDLNDARLRLRSLVSRETAALDHERCASAAVEAVSENLADSLLAPLLFYALAGLPGAVAYRVVNTADAMYGYHGGDEWRGKVAARLDDLVNWVPSRVAALCLVAASGVHGPGRLRHCLAVMARDGGSTASPNAGWPMAAMAGAMNCRLEKPGQYVLGAHSQPIRPDQVAPAVAVAGTAALLGCGLALLCCRH